MDELSYDVEAAPAAESFLEHPLRETTAEAERLAARIEREVWRETSGLVRNLRVEVNREGVLLTGSCPTYYAKQRAQHAAMRVPGGGQLTNQIEVL